MKYNHKGSRRVKQTNILTVYIEKFPQPNLNLTSTSRSQALFILFNEQRVTTGKILIYLTHGPLTRPEPATACPAITGASAGTEEAKQPREIITGSATIHVPKSPGSANQVARVTVLDVKSTFRLIKESFRRLQPRRDTKRSLNHP